MPKMESRLPPQNLEAEQSVLGSILLDNEVFAAIEGTLSAEQFYKESHRKIFRVFEKLARRGEPIDLVTVTEELRQTGELEGVGSVPYLIGLADSVPTAAYAENYAKIVAEKAVLRDLIGASGQIMQTAYDQAMPLEQILDKAESSIFDLATNKRTHHFQGMGGLMTETFAQINELFNNPDPITGLRMGFKELDMMTAGLQPSSLNVLAARPSMGKCLAKGTKIVKYDGRLEAVENIQMGDLLMGSDSKPRRVLSVAKGQEKMYWVRQYKGVDYRVNESHILSLKRSRNPNKGEIIDISVRDFLSKSKKFQNNFKGFKVGIDLPEQAVPIDPYFIGLWLGDGRSGAVGITTQDVEIVDYLHGYAASLGMVVTKYDSNGERCPTYSITRGVHGGSEFFKASSLQGQLKALGLLKNKHIPDVYLYNSRTVRLSLLAGFIDSDGHYLATQNGPYEITTKNERLAKEIKYLVDSLGYRSSLISKKATLKSRCYECTVYRVRFNGNVDEIPVRIARKKAQPWTDYRNWQVTGIRVEPDVIDDYYGFTLSGDGRFLLEDMTVTHNTALALTIGQNAALRDSKTIGVFSLEMSAVQLVTRMLCSEARVDMSRVRNGQLSERDFQRLADTAGRMSEAKVFIDDNADMSVMELRSRARRLMAEHGLGLIIIDYLQLMSGSNKSAGGGENRQQEISVISRGLKALARELDIPVLVLSQLSRAVESRPNKRPMLSDLRECVTGDTLVALRDGRRVPIKDLVGTTPCVYAVTPEGKLTCAKSDKVWRVGKKEVFEVTLESGRTIKATAKHQLFSARGWQRVAELRTGDFLGVSRYMPEPSDPVQWPDHEVVLLGHLIGDGSYLNHRPLKYTTISEDNSKAVEEAAKALGSKVTRHAGRGNWHQLVIAGNGNRWHPSGVGKWLKDLGIFNQRSHEKQVPESAFRLRNEQVALLLKHLWATDGCIHVRSGKGSNSIYYSTTSSTLAQDVAALLLRFGIVARIRLVGQGKYKPSYHVSVTGLENQQTFLKVIGGFGPRREHAERLVKALEGKKANTNVDTIPKEIFSRIRELMKVKGISFADMARLRGTANNGTSKFRYSPSRKTLKQYAEILEDDVLYKLATNDLFWDRIKSITLAGEEDVYDLTVPGPSSWLADSIVSHNSGAIEQDADLVMFIYRDEYYDQQSEKQGIAEIIIGKQRNGPVGTVELQFHSAHVRFNDLAKPT
jgi:replicative DNA helicase